MHPIASSPFKCWSIGRAPIAQPPGNDTFAWPNLATKGPSTRTLARICLTSSYGASGRTLDPAATSTSGAATRTSRPKKRKSAAVVSMSRSAGTLRKRLPPSDRSVAQRIGSAAFLAPLIRTEPRSGPLARIRIASTSYRLHVIAADYLAGRLTRLRNAQALAAEPGKARPSAVTIQTGGRDARTRAPRASRSALPSAASTLGKS